MKNMIFAGVCIFSLFCLGCNTKREWSNPVDPKIPPEATTLSSPVQNSTGIDINPVLTWNDSEGATSYTLQISNNSACTSFVYNQSGIVSTSDTVTGLSYSTSYYWRVRADKKDISSAWTSVWQFKTKSATAPIVVTTPATSITQTTAQLNGTVNPNNIATTYYFQYGTTTSYGTNTATQNAGTGTSAVAVNAVIGSLTAGTTYHYRVAATNLGGASYGNDGIFITVPAAPILSLPANDSTGINLNPTLTWNASSGATSYALQVSMDSLFGSFIYNQSGLTAISQTISGLSAGIKYYWRVRATNSTGTSNWSSVWSFITSTLSIWTQQYTGVSVGLFVDFPHDTIVGYAVGGEQFGNTGVLLKTTDGGLNWISKTIDADGCLSGVSFPTDNNIGYTCGYNGNLFKTTNGGSTWAKQYLPSGYENIDLYDIQFPSDVNLGYAVGFCGHIFKTVNGGADWSVISSLSEIWFVGLSFVSNATGFIGGCPSSTDGYVYIYKTTDGGINWVGTNTGYTDPIYHLDFPNLNTGYASGNNGTVLKTTNSGSTWFKQNTGISGNFGGLFIFDNGTTGYAVGEFGKIIKTIDGGQTWFVLVSPTTSDLGEVCFPTNGSIGFISGSNGEIYKTSSGGE